MSKTFVFSTTKQKLTVDTEAFSLLQSWQEALVIAFAISLETISDLENSLYSKLAVNKTLTQEVVARAIADLHNLDQEEILKVGNSLLNKFYLNPNRAVLSGVCDMMARVTGWNTGFFRCFYLIFWFISGGLGFWFYLGLSLVLPSTENSLTNFLMKAMLGENTDFLEEKLDQRPSWVKKIDKVLDFVCPIIFRFLSTLALLGCFIFSLIYSYVCTGLILQKIGLWPDVSWITTDLIDMDKTPTAIVILFFTILLLAVLLGCYLLVKLIKEIRLPKVNPKSIYKKISLLGTILLIFWASQNIFTVQDQDLASKTFPIGEAQEIVILQNGFFCSTKYRLIIEKSDLNTVSLIGSSDRISDLTFENQGQKESAMVTNIYPFRTCFSREKLEVTIIIKTNRVGIKILNAFMSFDSNYTTPQTIIFGFKEGEIELADNQPNVIFLN